jgi:CRISPR/Cas system Type II protein with McrA/HNH and RuvC-like nuclease domain
MSVDDNKVTAKRLRRLLEKQGYKCFFSGRPLEPNTASVDHLLPVSRGGTNTIDNVCVVHMDINRAKGTLTASEFIGLCREVVEHANRYEFTDNE